MRLSQESLKKAVINLMDEDDAIMLQASRILLDAGADSLDTLVNTLRDNRNNFKVLVCLWRHLKQNMIYNKALVDTILLFCNSTNNQQSQVVGMAILGEIIEHAPHLVPQDSFSEFFLHHNLVLQIRSLTLAVQYKLEYAVPWLGILLDDDYEAIQKLALEGLRQSKSAQAAYMLREWERRQ